MPTVDIDMVMEGLKELLKIDADWVPHTKGTSLYIRSHNDCNGALFRCASCS